MILGITELQTSKEWIVSGEVTFLGGKQWFIRWITLLVLTSIDFLHEITFLGEVETTIRLDIKSLLGDVGLAQVTTF